MNDHILMHKALEENNHEKVQNLIETGYDINSTSNYSNSSLSPLHIGIEKKCDKRMIQLLLDHGADVNRCTYETPLYLSTKIQNNVEIIKLLLEHGAVPNIKDIINASKIENNAETIKLLFSHAKNIEQSDFTKSLCCVVRKQKNVLEIVQFLVEQGADVNYKFSPFFKPFKFLIEEEVRSYWSTPLIEACQIKNNLEVITFLLENGAHPNIIDDNLMQTSENFDQVISLLVKHGADINTKLRNGERIMFFAIRYQHARFVKMCLKLGAKIEATNSDGETALNIAVRFSTEKIVNLLIDHGANINSHDNLGRTPLYSAIFAGKLSVVETILKLGPNFNCNSELIKKLIDKIVAKRLSIYRETLLFSLKYFVKVKMLNLLDDDTLLVWNLFLELKVLKKLQINCKKEAGKLRARLICPDRSLTYSDILTKHPRKVAVYLNLEDVVNKINEVNFEKEFPNYSSLLKSRISRGQDLSSLLDKSYSSLRILLRDPRIHYSFLTDTLDYLNENDLRVLNSVLKSNRLE